MTYKHLRQTEHYQIYALIKAAQSLKTMALILGEDYQSSELKVLNDEDLHLIADYRCNVQACLS